MVRIVSQDAPISSAWSYQGKSFGSVAPNFFEFLFCFIVLVWCP
ncbi:MAG: hypothetical protein ACTSQP_21995 [Promethearchaeota archaeon]